MFPRETTLDFGELSDILWLAIKGGLDAARELRNYDSDYGSHNECLCDETIIRISIRRALNDMHLLVDKP